MWMQDARRVRLFPAPAEESVEIDVARTLGHVRAQTVAASPQRRAQ
jgi:hypothetical protein